MENKRALVTGFTGQDGTFLTENLLANGYEVMGMVRRVSTEPPLRQRGNFDFSESLKSGQLKVVGGDLLAVSSLMRIVKDFKPDHIYNMAAQSHVGISFEQPEFTTNVNYLGLLNLMNAVDEHAPHARLYQASTSEMFGNASIDTTHLNELSPFNPNSPYAISKAASHYAMRARRERGQFAASGILFNHESEIRGGDFVTQKIVQGLIRHLKTGEILRLGNLGAKRDWGFAGDYVEAMRLMLEHNKPGEFVVGTGDAHSVGQFAEQTAAALDKELIWKGEGGQTKGYIDEQLAIEVDPKYFRPNELHYLRADAAKARGELKWRPKITFSQLIKRMVDAEMER